jgi:hypothetical protein
MKNSTNNSQAGNVLFYILIAVVLLAALSFAVMQSGRGSISAVTEEKARMLAAEIIEYANIMANATAQVRLRDVRDTELCFDSTHWGVDNYPNPSCSDPATKIFDLKGGGVTWTNAPAMAMDTTASPDNLWHIYGNNAVQEIGTTCNAAACADLILVVDELREDICIQINNLVKVENPSDVPPIDTQIGTTRFIGTYDYVATLGDETSVLRGKTGACFRNVTTDEYTFYKVLVAR